jgi:hypothetical protein
MTPAAVLRGLFALLVAVCSFGLSPAVAATYVFTRIAESDEPSFRDVGPATAFDGGVAISDGGVVAFGSGACGGGIFAGAGGGPAAALACTDALRSAGIAVPSGVAPAIDAAGTVAFFALVDSGGAAEGEPTTQKGTNAPSGPDQRGAIATVAGGSISVVTGAAGRVLPVTPSIRAGAVVLVGERPDPGVFVQDARGVNLVARGSASRVALGPGGVTAFVGPRREDGSSLSVFRVDGGQLSLLADGIDVSAELAVDEAGRVAFATAAGVFVADGQNVWRVAGSTTFDGFEPSGIGVDAGGRIAFIARLSPAGMGRGIFVGPDPVLDRVIAAGDPLAGSVVVDLVLAPSRSIAMNAAGQLAFVARLADGRTAVFRADPVTSSLAEGDDAGGSSARDAGGSSATATVGADCPACAMARTASGQPSAGSRTTSMPLSLALASTITISGRLYSDEGVTPTSGTLKLAIGGATALTTTAGADGQFSFTGIALPAAGTVLTVWVDNTAGKKGAVVTRYPGAGDVLGLDVYLLRLIARHDDAGPLTNTDLRVCSKSTGIACKDTDLHFAVNGTTLALTVDKDWMLYVWPGTTFSPGGNVTLAAGTAATAPGGDLKLGASTSTLNVGAKNLTVGGDWDNTAGGTFQATGNQLVTFTGVGAGFRLSGLLTGTSSFRRVLFKSATGHWTIRNPLRVASTASDAFKVTSGTVTLGDGPGDDLEVDGGLVVASVPGGQATLQVALLPPGQRITIDINSQSLPTCTTCKIVVSGGTGRGILKLNRSTILRLNARPTPPVSDAGVEVNAGGYLEIQGSLDESGAAGAQTDEITLSDPTKSWSPGQHDGKVLRISSPASLAFGRVYRITGTTATSVLRADTSSPSAAVSAVSGTGTSRTLCLDHAGVITANREGIGRYLEIRSPGSGLLRVVHSVNDDPTCGGTDSVVVIGEPDPLSLAVAGAVTAIVDGVRPGDAYEIFSPAEVGADTGPACASVVGGAGAATFWAKKGSETVIRWAHICNIGREGNHKDALVFEGVNGANPNEGVTITHSWIHDMGDYAINLVSSSNNAGAKGISDNYVASTESYAIFLIGQSSGNAIVRNRVFDGVNAVALAVGTANNLIAFNHLHGGNNLNATGVHNSGTNNTVAYNQLYGNEGSGLRMTKSTRKAWVHANEIFGNGDAGVSVESSQEVTLFQNRVHANSVAFAVSVADGLSGAVTGLRSIADTLGTPADNRFGEIGYAGDSAHATVLYGTRFASATDANRIARSGNVGHGQSTSMSRVVSGPGTLTFDWAASSERGFDILSFSVNGVTVDSLSGAQPWQSRSVALPSGTVTIRFTYKKDGTDSHAMDAGMVDNVRLDGALIDDFESGGLAGWMLEGVGPWRNTARIEAVSGVVIPSAYVLARRADDVAGLTRVYGQYRIPAQVAETPQDETVETFAFADPLWTRSATVHGYRGSGTEDLNLDYALAGANLAGGPYHYRAVAATGGTCGAAAFAVTRNGTAVGTAHCGVPFTDPATGVAFRIDGGSPTAYAVGDTYAFVTWDAAGDGGVAKQLVMQQDGDRLTVPAGARLVLRGSGPGTNVTTITRGDAGGYQVVVDGAIDANAYAFSFLGGTGQSAGLVLNATAMIVSLDNGAFDGFAVAPGGVAAFVQVDAALIGSGTPSRQLVGMQFENSTGLATCNLNSVGSASGFWQIAASGSFAGEAHDCAGGEADGTPGNFDW